MRIIVVGASGSGKTTFARRVEHRLRLPRIELDAINWQAGWRDIRQHDPDEFVRRVTQAIAADEWVADGNYGDVRDLIWRRATHLVWLDYPRPVVMTRVVLRSLARVVLRTELWPGTGNHEHWRDLWHPDHPIRDAWHSSATYLRDYADCLKSPEYAHLHVQRLRHPAATQRALEVLAANAYAERSKSPVREATP
jgi:hypothetical protein